MNNTQETKSRKEKIFNAIAKERLAQITVDGIKPVDDVEFFMENLENYLGEK